MTHSHERRGESFEDLFQQRLAQVRHRAAKNGLGITALCEQCGVAADTPRRWAAQSPKTVRILDRLEKALDEHEFAEPSET